MSPAPKRRQSKLPRAKDETPLCRLCLQRLPKAIRFADTGTKLPALNQSPRPGPTRSRGQTQLAAIAGTASTRIVLEIRTRSGPISKLCLWDRSLGETSCSEQGPRLPHRYGKVNIERVTTMLRKRQDRGEIYLSGEGVCRREGPC